MLRSNLSLDERIELNRTLNRFLVVMLLLCLSGVGLTLKLASDLHNLPGNVPELSIPQGMDKINTVQVRAWPKKEKPEGANPQALDWKNSKQR